MTTEVNYSLYELEQKSLAFLKENKKKDCKGMPKSEIQEWAHQKAAAAKNYAKSLMATGTPDFVAWPMAIRQEILESETD